MADPFDQFMRGFQQRPAPTDSPGEPAPRNEQSAVEPDDFDAFMQDAAKAFQPQGVVAPQTEQEPAGSAVQPQQGGPSPPSSSVQSAPPVLPPSAQPAPSSAEPAARGAPGFDEFMQSAAMSVAQKPGSPEAFGSVFRGVSDLRLYTQVPRFAIGEMDARGLAESIVANEQTKRQFPKPEALRRFEREFSEAEDTGEALGALQENPGALPSLIGETLTSSLPSFAAGFAGSFIGGPPGAMAGFGAGSAAVEFGASYVDYIRRKARPRTVEEWERALSDPNLINEAAWFAGQKAPIVGAMDIAGAKLGGRAATKYFYPKSGLWKKGFGIGAGIGIEGGTEAAGEFAGSSVAARRFADPKDAALEGVLGVFAGGPSVAFGALQESRVQRSEVPAREEDFAAAVESMEGFQPRSESALAPNARIGFSSTAGPGRPAPTFYSALERAVEDKVPESATPEQILRTVEKTPGIKKEEIEWSGIVNELPQLVDEKGKVSKDAVRTLLEENRIEVSETVRRRQVGDSEQGPVRDRPRYEEYTMPGEREEYGELLLQPPGDISEDTFVDQQHWSEQDVLAWTRFSGRRSRDGRSTLLVEEVQSTWHQKLRRGGVAPSAREEDSAFQRSDFAHDILMEEVVKTIDRSPGSPEEKRRKRELLFHIADRLVTADRTQTEDPIASQFLEDVREDEPNLVQAMQDRVETQREFREVRKRRREGAPDAPFKSSWEELAVKRMLRWAADNGYDRVALAPGREQVARYPGMGESEQQGLINFYDKKLTNVFKKWGKRVGGSVGQENLFASEEFDVTTAAAVGMTDIPGETIVVFDAEQGRVVALAENREEAETIIGELRKEAQDLVYVDLPPDAVTTIQKGLPLFSRGKGQTVSVADETEFGQPSRGDASLNERRRGALRLANAILEIKQKLGIRPALNVAVVDRFTRYTNSLGFFTQDAAGDYTIVLNLERHASEAEVWSTLTHELGHVVQEELYKRAPGRVKFAVETAYRENRRAFLGSDTLQTLLIQRDNVVSNYYGTRGEAGVPLHSLPPEQRRYWSSFEEWFAEQVARWATTSDKPIGLAEKHFKGIADRLRKLYRLAAEAFGMEFQPEARIKEWLDSFLENGKPFAHEVHSDLAIKTRKENQSALTEAGMSDVKAAERQPETEAVLEGLRKVMGGGPLPLSVRSMVAEADKMNRFYKWAISLPQLAELNPGVRPLQEYSEEISLASLDKQDVINQALEVANSWKKLLRDQSDALTDLLDDVSNMVYRTEEEVEQETQRWPTEEEFQKLVQKHKVGREALDVYRKVVDSFSSFLGQVEQVLVQQAQRKISNEEQRADRINDIQRQFNALRRTPYFPHMRFGPHVVLVRNADGKIIYREHFESKRKMQQAARALEKKIDKGAGEHIQMDQIAEQSLPLQGIPPGLLDLIDDRLALSAQQRQDLELLRFELAPAHSFKHRFQRRRGTPGYSRDFRRAYASYFFHGANYLTRVKYVDRLRELVKETHDQADFMPDARGRRQIANFMTDHLEEWLDPKPDFTRLRALTFHWMLGFAPASAALNLTQTLTTTYPLLAAHFGDVRTSRELLAASTRISNFYKRGSFKEMDLSDFNLRALNEALNEGFLKQSQAPELAASTEERNLEKGVGGNIWDEAYQTIGRWSGEMFGLAEQFNRRVAFDAMLRLAQRNPDNRFVRDSAARSTQLFRRLRDKGWSEAEATAFAAARRLVLATQFDYSRESQPRFMRGRLRTVFVFKTFVQNQLFFLHNYSEARTRSLLVWAALGGLMGIPGAEDLEDLVKTLGFQLFNDKWDVRKKLREYVNELTNNPHIGELLLHGSSRYGMGLPHILNALGGTVGIDIPYPVVDRSRAVGMGKIFPIQLSELLGPGQSTEDVLRQGQRAAGATFGLTYNIIKFLRESQNGWTQKRVEYVLPRFAKSISRSWAAYRDEGVFSGDARILKMDPSEPRQMAEILAMAAGYQPLRLSREWDIRMMQRETEAYWNFRRGMLLQQMFSAIRHEGSKEQKDVRGAIRKYNRDLPRNLKGLAITGDTLRRSMRTRFRRTQEREQRIPNQRGATPAFRDIEGLFPEGEGLVEVKKVR